jgi:hypothetical protein
VCRRLGLGRSNDGGSSWFFFNICF